GRGLLHAPKANLHGHIVLVPLRPKLLHRDRLPVEAELRVAALPHALGQDLPGLVEVRADGLPPAPACRIVILDHVLLPPFPDGPQLTASFLAEAMPAPSDRSGLHGGKRSECRDGSQRRSTRMTGRGDRRVAADPRPSRLSSAIHAINTHRDRAEDTF